MNVSIHQGLVELFRTVSREEAKRNSRLSSQSEKILSTLAQIRALEKQRRNEARRTCGGTNVCQDGVLKTCN